MTDIALNKIPIKRIGVVYNPAKNMKAFHKAIDAFRKNKFQLEIIASASFNDVIVQANKLTSNKNIDLLLIGGGDGTVLAAINGMASFEIPIGILPLGCSNDFCHSLGIHNINDAIAAIENGNTIKADLGIAHYLSSGGAPKTMYFCSTAGIGFISAILKIENRCVIAFLKKLVKDAVWAVLAVYHALFSKHLFVQVLVNNKEVYNRKTRLLEVSKVKTAGGVPFTPDAELTNKSLDLWFTREMNPFKFLYTVIIITASATFKKLEQIAYFSSGPMGYQGHAPVKNIHVKGGESMPIHLNGEYLGECNEVSFCICNTHNLTVLRNG